MSITILIWIAFLSFIAVMVALDLGVFHRKAHVVSLPEAFGWTSVWVVLALLFNFGVYYLYEYNPAGWDMDTARLSGQEAAIQFFTGYLVEKSLSIDNIFVIAMVFTYFRIPLEHQHRVLFWGILGAVVLRAGMILGGVAAIERFEWLTYVLGVLLIYSGSRMLVMRDDNVVLERKHTLRFIKRFFPVTDELHGRRFFVKIDGVKTATPLFLALVFVETSDVMFAIDSIPAIFAITRDPFIVFTSNVFAILGLRSLYFVLAGMMDKFRYLKTSLAFLLAYIGIKMLLVHHYPIPNNVSLAVIGGILLCGILASGAAGRDTAPLRSPLSINRRYVPSASYYEARTAAVLLSLSSLIVIGLLMWMAPMPRILVVPLGVVVMALQLGWAGRWLWKLRREEIRQADDAVTERASG